MQIQSMALVHEHLYQSGTFGSVDIQPYVESLCVQLFDVYAVDTSRIQLDMAVQSILVDMQKAMPVALILNELISNSIKYAFPNDASGVIRIRIETIDHTTVELEIQDDGVGLPEDFDIAGSHTLGHTLIHSLASQINGTIAVDGTEGTRFLLQFAI